MVSPQPKTNELLSIKRVGSTLVATFGGSATGEFLAEHCRPFADLVSIADRDATVSAVVFTSAHQSRFISHASIKWLNSSAKRSLPISPCVAAVLSSMAGFLRRIPGVLRYARKIPFGGALQLDLVHGTFLKMNRSGVIFIAAVSGSAQGLGHEFIQACDFRLMADRPDIHLGQFEVLLGFNPGGGGTQRLAKLIGQRNALKMLLSGEPIGAQRALQMGLVDELVAPERLLDRALALATHFGSRSKAALGAIKRSTYFGASRSLAEGLAVERAEFLSLLTHREAQKSINNYEDLTRATGDLPLYQSELYARAVRQGNFEKTGN